MDKITFDKFLTDAAIGSEATFKFVSSTANLNGEYVIGGRKRGPGRGGSTLLVITNKETGVMVSEFNVVLPTNETKKISMGSPAKDYIESIVMNGITYESNNPLAIYPKNADKASHLFNVMGTLHVGNFVEIDSEAPQLNGNWQITKIEKTPGNPPQRKLSVKRVEGQNKFTADVYSYKMSGIVRSIKLINDTNTTPSAAKSDSGNPVGV